MRTSTFVRIGLFAALVSGASCGGAGFEPPSKIQGLRVLALQKEPAYPHPGETVQMKLLYWDGKVGEGSSRNVEFQFLQCDDPPGDLYNTCLTNPASLAPLGGGAPTMGNDQGAPTISFSTSIPTDKIVQPKFPIAYGLRYIFFTACAGQFKLEPANGLPFGCFDEADHALGPDDFVPGYSAIYVYDELRNANPVVDPALMTGFTDDLHVVHCTQSDRGNCPAFDVKPIIDRASAEVDPLG